MLQISLLDFGKYTTIKLFTFGLFSFLFTTVIHAQSISYVEKMASQGYAKRFSDTVGSLKIQQQALSLAIKNKSKDDEVICYAYLALTQKRLLHLKGFMHYADTAYYLSQTVNNERAKAHAAAVMGSLKSYIEDKPEALNYLLESYKLFSKIKAHDQCAKIASDISYLFSPASPPKVEKYAREAMVCAAKSGDSESQLHARLAFGSFLTDNLETGGTGDWETAMKFFKETILLAEENADKIVSKSNIGIAYINLADLYTKGPQPIDEEAFLMNLKKATAIAKKYNVKIIYRSAIGLQGYYFTQKGDYVKAELLFINGIKYQKSLPYTDNYLLATFYSSLKDVSVKRKDFQAYYGYDTLYTKYNQLKYNESTQSKLQNAEARYESSKKAERIKQLEQENELQQKNKLLGYGIAGVLLIGLVFMFRSYHYRQRYYQNREDFLKQEQANSELKVQLMEKETIENLSARLSLERRLLRSQMDPHFIFNALGNIQSMILQKDTIPAVSYLNKFAKLTRQVLEQSRKETISLEEEINTLKNYIELQQLRLNNGFDYVIECNYAVETDILIPPLLIQPFIENAVEHGLKPQENNVRGLIEIYFEEEETGRNLICTIKDNGIGLAASRKLKINNKHQSLSTTITDERLTKMQKDNPNAGFILKERDPETDGQGCIVILNIPIL
ncbi:histidine kinase [Flavobacterium piscis]|uniref:Signal transduction histidine kinase n=1 Tax=Flavobacterium piscis TaxID=1114874 RepID=A0ABU1YDW6_9FLAO|nr:histidine kinase [Flavobacterium piscis]MDR7212412.1 signal transduction histidine kinase [Flavobacterium piscis]